MRFASTRKGDNLFSAIRPIPLFRHQDDHLRTFCTNENSLFRATTEYDAPTFPLRITSAMNRSAHRVFLLVFSLAFVAIIAQAQSSEEIHVTPRVQSPPIAPPIANVPVLSSRARPMHVDVDLVLVPVTVTDVKGKSVMDLHKEDFKLFEGDEEAKVRYFFAQDTPVSVGVVVDLSSSMKNKVDRVREAVDEFFKNADPADDYFVVTFANRPKLLANTTTSISTIQAQLAQMEAKGNTALADAIYLSLLKLHNSKYERKALVVISDGGDNASRNSLRKVKNLAKEADAQVYAIDVCDAPSVLITKKLEERFGRQWLSQVSEVSGGRTIAVDDPRKIPDAAAQISIELRNQYVLGFRPSTLATDGKWRKIKVRVSRKDDPLPLQLYYKTGYMAQKRLAASYTRSASVRRPVCRKRTITPVSFYLETEMGEAKSAGPSMSR